MADLYLNEIKLTNFKNYTLQHIEFSPQVNCIVGLNGMGKTNLLDAVYYLCMCKSHFGVSDTVVKQHETSFFRLEGVFVKEKKSFQTVAKVIPKEKKEFECGGVIYEKLADHIGTFPVVMITPFDIELVLEGSEVRRKFMDNTLSQLDPAYLKALMLYNRILRQRNAALKKFGESGSVDHKLLDIFDQQLVAPARLIHEKRKNFCQQFIPLFSQYYKIISNDQEKVDFAYRSALNEKEIEVLLTENRSKDLILQRTSAGLHRDDLNFRIAGYPLKKYASQGQSKSFILSLKLAQYELLKKEKACQPLLLLDDIFDKLDSERVRQLVALLFEKKIGQIFFTDTHENRLADILTRFEVDFRRFIINFGEVLKNE